MQKPVTPTLPLPAGGLQEFHGSAHVLSGGVAEIQVLHQVLGLVCLQRDLAAIQVGHQRAITRRRELVRHAADLVVQTPPLLDHNDARRACRRGGFGEIAVDACAIGPRKADRLAHGLLRECPNMRGIPRANPNRIRARRLALRIRANRPGDCLGSTGQRPHPS